MKNNIFIHYIVPFLTFFALILPRNDTYLKLLLAIIAITIIVIDTVLKLKK